PTTPSTSTVCVPGYDPTSSSNAFLTRRSSGLAPARGPGLSGPEKRNRPRRSGACVETRRWRRSEAVLGRHAVQVGAAVERADDAAAAGGDVHARVVRLQVAEGEVDVELVADRPGGADRVPATVVVGQARGPVHQAGRGLVVGDAAAQGPAVVELVLGAQRHEGRVAPLERLDRVRIRVVEL